MPIRCKHIIYVSALCDDIDCMNGGTCDSGICECADGFTGSDCSTGKMIKF